MSVPHTPHTPHMINGLLLCICVKEKSKIENDINLDKQIVLSCKGIYKMSTLLLAQTSNGIYSYLPNRQQFDVILMAFLLVLRL